MSKNGKEIVEKTSSTPSKTYKCGFINDKGRENR
jgi:hypothetical protein